VSSGVQALTRSGVIPADVTSFVGRRREVAHVKRLLATARLVTLTGVGGAGKTRLALRVAAESRRAFPDGTWLADLAPVQDASLVDYAVAAALGVRDQTERPMADVIAEHLRDRELLLVMDNCEHLLDSCAAFAGTVLRAAPGLRILCTSRQSLGMVGEHLWTVPPMQVQDPPGSVPGDTDIRSAAVALFTDRAVVAAPGFALDADNTEVVVDICRRLDGLPLAIELAAAQLRKLTVEQLRAALRDRFRVLSARHAVPAHHRTLAATFDWSFDLCSPAERSLWQRMSVFADSFELDAIAYVCGDDASGGRPVLETVVGLVDKSVLGREDAGGQVRYRLLETVRQYGLERLRAEDRNGGDEETALRRRHRDWYAGLAERFAAEWFGPDQPAWSARLRSELGNVRAAINFSLATPGERHVGLAITVDTYFLWYGGGLLHEGRHWFDQALRANPQPTVVRLEALALCSLLATTQGNLGEGTSAAQECLDSARRLDEPAYVTRATASLGIVALMGNDLPEARRLLEEALAGFEAEGKRGVHATIAELSLAMALLYQGDVAGAARLCGKNREACRDIGEHWWQAYALNSSALVAMAQGEFAAATDCLRESLRLRQPLGDLTGMAGAIERLGWTAAQAGDDVRAAVLLGAAHRLWQEVGRTLYGATQWLRGHHECVSRLRRVLGAAAYDRAFARGAGLSLDEAISYAIETDPPAVARPGPASPAALTPRERQVAELVTQGLSNKQVAARLVVSQRTAEGHVENILRKLGLTSRTQLAAWVSRQERT